MGSGNTGVKVSSAAAVVSEFEVLRLFHGLFSYVLVAGEVSSSVLMVIPSLLTMHTHAQSLIGAYNIYYT